MIGYNDPFFILNLKENLFKIIFIIILLAGLQNPFLFVEAQPLVREIVAFENDTTFKYTYYYDDYRNKVMENKYYVKDNATYPLTRTEWVYQGKNCTQQRQQKWIIGNWETFFLINSVYANNLKIKETNIAVSDNIEKVEKTIVNNYLNNHLQSTIHYQGDISDNHIIQELQFNYNIDHIIQRQQIHGYQSPEANSSQILKYIYAVNGVLDSLILFNHVQDEDIKETLTTYLYDKHTGKLTSQIQKKWNKLAAKWENETKTEFVYDANHDLTSEIYSHHSGMFWTPNTKYDYEYDSNGLLQSKIMFQPIYRQWRRIYTIDYSDIAHEKPNLMESKYNFWGGNTGDYMNNYIPYYFNDEMQIMRAGRMEIKYILETTVVTKSSFEPDWLKIYPNPSTGVFYISTQDYFIESWEVFNVNGMMVKNNINRYHTGVIDLTSMPDGMYMIKALTNANQQLKQKIIIQRK